VKVEMKIMTNFFLVKNQVIYLAYLSFFDRPIEVNDEAMLCELILWC